MSEKLVIVPTYNEIENIDRIVEVVLGLPVKVHLLIVDDNSPDGTSQRIRELQSEHSDALHLLERSGKLGLGTAYIKGFFWALDRGYKYICEMDADFSHNPLDLPGLFDACENESADVAIGSSKQDFHAVIVVAMISRAAAKPDFSAPVTLPLPTKPSPAK